MTHRFLTATALLLAPVAVQAQPGSPTLEQRVQKMEDEAAIKRIIVEYAELITRRDLDGYIALFAKDGVWQNGDVVRKGPEEIRALLTGLFGEQAPGYVNNETYMLVSNILVDVNGDRATAHSRQSSIRRGPDGSPVNVLGGAYEDEFIRENGEWKILRRNDITIMPTREEWMKIIAERRAAEQKQGD